MLTTPVVRLLKTQVPDAEVHFLTKQKHVCLLEANPYIDQIHFFNKKLDEIIPALKKEKFEAVIDLHHNLRSMKVKYSLSAPAYSFRKLNFEKWLLVNLKVDKLPNIHIVERYLETLSQFEITNDGQGLDYFIPEKETFNTGDLPESFQQGFIAVILAGTYFTKRLPAEKYMSLLKNEKYRFLLLGGHEENLVAEKIVETCSTNVINFCGQLTINQSASIVQQAKLVISNDTGLMHIAAAFRKKILSVWGNTVPQLGMHPYLPADGSRMLEVAGLKCRPCSKLGKHECPKNHFRCMNEISEAALINWVNNNY